MTYLRGVPNRDAIKNALDLVGLPYKDIKLFSQYSLFYSFCGIFVAERKLVNFYPMTTGLVLSNYAHDEKIAYLPLLSLGILIVILVCSLILLKMFDGKRSDI